MSIYVPKVAKDVSVGGKKRYENIQERKDGKFRVHVRWTRRNGKTYEKDKIFTTLSDARNFRNATYDDFNQIEGGMSVSAHPWVGHNGPTVNDVYSIIITQEWSSTNKGQKQYAQLISDYVLPTVGNLPIKLVKVADLKNLIREFIFSEIYAQRSAREIRSVYPSMSLARRLKISLSQFFQFALENEFVDKNPVRDVKIKWTKLYEERSQGIQSDDDSEENYSHFKYLAPTIRAELLEAARDTLAFPPILLMDRLGLRPGEALALRKADFNFVERNVRIRRQHLGGGKFGATKTRKNRTIPVPSSLLEWIKSLQISDNAPICANSEDGFLDDRRFRRVFQIARDKAISVNKDFPAEVTAYWLRHSWCSRMLNEVKESPVIVAAVSGHDVKVLLDYYAHPDESSKRRMMDASEEFNA